MAGLLLDNNLKGLRKGRGYGITQSRPTVPALNGRDRGEARKISKRFVKSPDQNSGWVLPEYSSESLSLDLSKVHHWHSSSSSDVKH